jgi:glycosyltransferase involved in cell wall biosynthesis
MDFTIMNPSLGQLEYLGCCIASVADQEDVSIEHIVQNGGTGDFFLFCRDIGKTVA